LAIGGVPSRENNFLSVPKGLAIGEFNTIGLAWVIGLEILGRVIVGFIICGFIGTGLTGLGR
jgi:hypothetical protein